MAAKHSSPGWIARLGAILAVAGTVLTALGLVLGYLNYGWQRENGRREREIQEESTAERILVRLDASRPMKGLTLNDLKKLTTPKHFVSTGELPPFDRIGEVGMEITNIGLRPLFIKRAVVRIGTNIIFFHDSLLSNDEPAKTNEATKLLEPSEAIRYPISWDFYAYHADFYAYPAGTMAGPPEDMEVQVQTTKNTFSCQHQFVNRNVWVLQGEGNKFEIKSDISQPGPSKQPPPCSQGGPP